MTHDFVYPRVNAQLQLLPPAYQAGQSIESIKVKYGLDRVVKLASNENPLGAAVELANLDTVLAAQYPDIAFSKLVPKLCRKHQLSDSQLILGNGSDEVLQLLALAYLGPDDSMMTSTVTFSQYAFVAKLVGAQVKYVPIKNNAYNLEGFKAAYSPQVKMICIANPNNPTGTLVSGPELIDLLDFVASSTIVVLDEAYCDYVLDSSYPDSRSLLDRYPNLIVTRTFSKLYGLANYRIGYGFAHSKLIEPLKRIKQPFNVNGFALKSAELALDNIDFIQRSLDLNETAKQNLYTFFKEHGISYQKTQANFIYFELPNIKNVLETCIKSGVIIRSLTSFSRPHAYRVTLGTPDQLMLFKKGILNCLNG